MSVWRCVVLAFGRVLEWLEKQHELDELTFAALAYSSQCTRLYNLWSTTWHVYVYVHHGNSIKTNEKAEGGQYVSAKVVGASYHMRGQT